MPPELSECAAAVFCAESYNALAVVRSLGRRGLRVITLGQETDSITFHSRYAAERIVYPDPVTDEAGFLRVVLALGKRQTAAGLRTVVFATSDRIVKLLSTHRAALGELFELYLPPPAVVETSLDKLAQYRVAERVGVPYPRTYANGDLDRMTADLANGRAVPPLFLKARMPLEDHALARFRRMKLETAEHAAREVAEAERLRVPYVVQEIIPGGDDQLYTLGSTMNADGELVSAFTGRKLRQMPPGFGICRVGESRPVPEVADLGRRLLAAIGFHGISQVEFKFDVRDGQFKLMEVNPRSWSWIGLPIELGADLPWAMFCEALGHALLPQEKLPPQNWLWISLTHDLERSLEHRDGRPWAHLFAGHERIVEAFYAADDPAPAIAHFGQAARAWGGRLLGKFTKLARRSPIR
jgi:predicted ATP-grasp superfamily ATP-dependent carboligase